MEAIKELLIVGLVAAFVGLLIAGHKHVHSGASEGHSHAENYRNPEGRSPQATRP